jgi:hypothetical protein
MSPLPQNGSEQGFLWFIFDGLNHLLLKQPETQLILTARSVDKREITVSKTVREIAESARETKFFPGLTNPRPLQIPCKEGARY